MDMVLGNGHDRLVTIRFLPQRLDSLISVIDGQIDEPISRLYGVGVKNVGVVVEDVKSQTKLKPYSLSKSKLAISISYVGKNFYSGCLLEWFCHAPWKYKGSAFVAIDFGW